MFINSPIAVNGEVERSDEDLKRMYGEDAIISRVGKYNLIHLDKPGPEEVRRRVDEFDPNSLFDDDCPICRMLRDQPGDVVYNDTETGDYEDDAEW